MAACMIYTSTLVSMRMHVNLWPYNSMYCAKSSIASLDTIFHRLIFSSFIAQYYLHHPIKLLHRPIKLWKTSKIKFETNGTPYVASYLNISQCIASELLHSIHSAHHFLLDILHDPVIVQLLLLVFLMLDLLEGHRSVSIQWKALTTTFSSVVSTMLEQETVFYTTLCKTSSVTRDCLGNDGKVKFTSLVCVHVFSERVGSPK